MGIAVGTADDHVDLQERVSSLDTGNEDAQPVLDEAQPVVLQPEISQVNRAAPCKMKAHSRPSETAASFLGASRSSPPVRPPTTLNQHSPCGSPVQQTLGRFAALRSAPPVQSMYSGFHVERPRVARFESAALPGTIVSVGLPNAEAQLMRTYEVYRQQ